MRIIGNQNSRRGGATVAQVSFSDSAGIGAVTFGEARDVPIFAPRGISYKPCEGDRMLMLQADGAETCVGCLSVCTDIESGELKLTSAGGATLKLKNNGEVEINGLTITRNGTIVPAGQGAGA